MTRWGFDRMAGRRRRPNPLVRRGRARRRMALDVGGERPAAAPVARQARIDLATAPSGMEMLAAGWRRG